MSDNRRITTKSTDEAEQESIEKIESEILHKLTSLISRATRTFNSPSPIRVRIDKEDEQHDRARVADRLKRLKAVRDQFETLLS